MPNKKCNMFAWLFTPALPLSLQYTDTVPRYHHRYWPFISLCWFVNFLYFRAVVSGLRCKIFMLWTDCLRWSHYQKVISRYENAFMSKGMKCIKFPNFGSIKCFMHFRIFEPSAYIDWWNAKDSIWCYWNGISIKLMSIYSISWI